MRWRASFGLQTAELSDRHIRQSNQGRLTSSFSRAWMIFSFTVSRADVACIPLAQYDVWRTIRSTISLRPILCVSELFTLLCPSIKQTMSRIDGFLSRTRAIATAFQLSDIQTDQASVRNGTALLFAA